MAGQPMHMCMINDVLTANANTHLRHNMPVTLRVFVQQHMQLNTLFSSIILDSMYIVIKEIHVLYYGK